ncbi:radical SAM protein, partial [Candidatus Bathyarchaeota archaeon]
NPPPEVSRYRRIQLARHLIFHKIVRYEDMRFDGEERIKDFGVGKEVLLQIVRMGKPFLTSGCPNCNRPYYNEKPSSPIYNYPRPLKKEEIAKVMLELDIA